MRRWHVYLIVWGLFLLALSFIPGRQMPAQKIQADKFLHLLAFAYLGYLAARSLGWWAVFLVIGFAAVNEVQQFFAAGREVSWIDLAANQVGALLGFALGYLRRRRALQAA